LIETKGEGEREYSALTAIKNEKEEEEEEEEGARRRDTYIPFILYSHLSFT